MHTEPARCIDVDRQDDFSSPGFAPPGFEHLRLSPTLHPPAPPPRSPLPPVHTQFSTHEFTSQDLIQRLGGQTPLNFDYMTGQGSPESQFDVRFDRVSAPIPADLVLKTGCIPRYPYAPLRIMLIRTPRPHIYFNRLHYTLS